MLFVLDDVDDATGEILGEFVVAGVGIGLHEWAELKSFVNFLRLIKLCFFDKRNQLRPSATINKYRHKPIDGYHHRLTTPSHMI